MDKNFTNCTFHLYTEMVYGRDTEREVGRLVKKYGGSRSLLVYGGGSIKKSGLFERLAASLAEEGVSYVSLGGVKPNPRRSFVDEGVALAQKEKCDFVLAAGGGSVIDTAKAIALALANGGDYWQFFTGTAPEKMAGLGAINTIAAAGSEMSCSSVIVDDVSDPVNHPKKSLFYPCCRPLFAILNPELTYTVPPFQTGAGATDIFAHTVRRYFCRAFSRLADEYGEGTMRNVVRYGPIAVREPNNYEARAELMLSASFSHNDVTGIGRSGPSGGEHGLEAQLSAYYDTAHGAGLAVVMPAWLEYIARTGTAEQVARIARFGTKVFGVAADMDDESAVAAEGLRRFRAWLRSLGMPLTLKELGVPRSDFDAVIARCMTSHKRSQDSVGLVKGWVDLDENAVRAIFEMVID